MASLQEPINTRNFSHQHTNIKVDIYYGAHDKFLEQHSSVTLKNKRLEKQIIVKSLGRRKPKGLKRIAKKVQGY